MTAEPALEQKLAPAPRPMQIRGRAAVAVLVLAPLLVFFMVWGDWRVGGTGSEESLSSPAVAILCLMAALNVVLKRRRPAWAFTAGEMIVVYVVMAMAAGLTGSVWNWGGNLAPNIAYVIWQAGPANRWAEIMWPYLPPGLTVTDRDALAGFFLGSSTPYHLDVLLAWIQPILWWTAWVTAVLWVTLCLSVIVRRRWSEEEKLPFPLTVLPMQITDPEARLFKSSAWWVGVGVSGAMGLLGLLSSFFPSLPTIPTSADLTNIINNNPPWDAIRSPALYWGPWSIGLAYLMPVDLAFSLIVFNLFWRAEYIFSRAQGWLTSAWGGFPYGDQQVVGGYLAIMLSIAWLDRRYLAQVFRKAVGLRSYIDDSGEAFSYRTAVFGMLAGIGFLWYFFARSGMSPTIIASFLALFFIMIMAMIRMRAHIGPPSHWMYGTMPEFVFTEFPGARAIGPGGLGMIALLRPFMYEQNSHPAPLQVEALRMSERGVMEPKRLAWILALAVPVIMLAYFWASLHVGYKMGMGAKGDMDMTFVCRQTSDKLDSWLRDPGGPNYPGVESIGIGFVVTIALMYLKLRSPLWPLHPVAFPLAFSWTIDAALPAIFIAWLVKVLLLRYGGLRAHRRALPLFLGLIAGDGTMSMLQTVILRVLGIEHR